MFAPAPIPRDGHRRRVLRSAKLRKDAGDSRAASRARGAAAHRPPTAFFQTLLTKRFKKDAALRHAGQTGRAGRVKTRKNLHAFQNENARISGVEMRAFSTLQQLGGVKAGTGPAKLTLEQTKTTLGRNNLLP